MGFVIVVVVITALILYVKSGNNTNWIWKILSPKKIRTKYDIPITSEKRTVVKPVDLEFEPSCNQTPQIVVFDTETTGLLPANMVSDDNYMEFPRIVQIAWMVFDKEMKIIKKQSYIIKQKNKIPVSAIEIHGITNEIADKEGVEIERAIKEFNMDIANAKVLVAHNMKFDYNVTKSEYMRLDYDYSALENIHKGCTMLMSIDFCAIKRYRQKGYKYPSLYETYRDLHPDKILQKKMLHNALTDVALCAKSLEAMWKYEIL